MAYPQQWKFNGSRNRSSCLKITPSKAMATKNGSLKSCSLDFRQVLWTPKLAVSVNVFKRAFSQLKGSSSIVELFRDHSAQERHYISYLTRITPNWSTSWCYWYNHPAYWRDATFIVISKFKSHPQRDYGSVSTSTQQSWKFTTNSSPSSVSTSSFLFHLKQGIVLGCDSV